MTYSINLQAALANLPATTLLILPDNTRVQVKSFVEYGAPVYRIISDSGNEWNELAHLTLGTREPIRNLERTDRGTDPVSDYARRTRAMYSGVGNFWLSLGILVKD